MRRGLVREDEIFEIVEAEVASERDAVRFSEDLASRTNDYTTILVPSHPRWRSVPSGSVITNHLKVLNDELQVKFHRALLLAVVSHFPDREILPALRWLTSLAVRLIVVGGSGSGKTEQAIGNGSLRIARKELTTAVELAKSLASIAPSNTEFETAFAEKRIDKSRIARYLLRSIEAFVRREEYPETVVVDDTNLVSLEHILPKKYPQGDAAWSHFTEDEHRAFAYRLGNLALMRSDHKSAVGQGSFASKRALLAEAVNVLTTKECYRAYGSRRPLDERRY